MYRVSREGRRTSAPDFDPDNRPGRYPREKERFRDDEKDRKRGLGGAALGWPSSSGVFATQNPTKVLCLKVSAALLVVFFVRGVHRSMCPGNLTDVNITMYEQRLDTERAARKRAEEAMQDLRAKDRGRAGLHGSGTGGQQAGAEAEAEAEQAVFGEGRQGNPDETEALAGLGVGIGDNDGGDSGIPIKDLQNLLKEKTDDLAERQQDIEDLKASNKELEEKVTSLKEQLEEQRRLTQGTHKGGDGGVDPGQRQPGVEDGFQPEMGSRENPSGDSQKDGFFREPNDAPGDLSNAQLGELPDLKGVGFLGEASVGGMGDGAEDGGAENEQDPLENVNFGKITTSDGDNHEETHEHHFQAPTDSFNQELVHNVVDPLLDQADVDIGGHANALTGGMDEDVREGMDRPDLDRRDTAVEDSGDEPAGFHDKSGDSAGQEAKAENKGNLRGTGKNDGEGVPPNLQVVQDQDPGNVGRNDAGTAEAEGDVVDMVNRADAAVGESAGGEGSSTSERAAKPPSRAPVGKPIEVERKDQGEESGGGHAAAAAPRDAPATLQEAEQRDQAEESRDEHPAAGAAPRDAPATLQEAEQRDQGEESGDEHPAAGAAPRDAPATLQEAEQRDQAEESGDEHPAAGAAPRDAPATLQEAEQRDQGEESGDEHPAGAAPRDAPATLQEAEQRDQGEESGDEHPAAAVSDPTGEEKTNEIAVLEAEDAAGNRVDEGKTSSKDVTGSRAAAGAPEERSVDVGQGAAAAAVAVEEQ